MYNSDKNTPQGECMCNRVITTRLILKYDEG